MIELRDSGLLFTALSLLVGCGPPRTTPREPSAPGPAETHPGVATQTAGTPIQEGASCLVAISWTAGTPFNCRVELRCGPEVLYGLPGTGFNHCSRLPGGAITAEDSHPTRADGDPIMRLDLRQGLMEVEDHDPHLSLTVALEPTHPK